MIDEFPGTRANLVDKVYWLEEKSMSPVGKLLLPSVHGSDAVGIQHMMNGHPEDFIMDTGNRVVDLERLAAQSDQKEHELRSRIDNISMTIQRHQ